MVNENKNDDENENWNKKETETNNEFAAQTKTKSQTELVVKSTPFPHGNAGYDSQLRIRKIYFGFVIHVSRLLKQTGVGGDSNLHWQR